MICPDCSILTPYHPADAVIRNAGIEFAKPITIENDVWLGGNVTIICGVTIGEGSVVGAGSVVVKDIPKGVIAVGNPCKVIRKIDEKDAILWQEKYDEYLIEMGEE
ncbi:DapH/DapD/GlmU-related protein [Anaerococcus cruorum]|uniref:DapH/DapD/GlmU-related protein n=1 Tax=Anaerococcus sp. WGS1529 TaxID=3366812 RepID=UPI00372D09EF